MTDREKRNPEAVRGAAEGEPSEKNPDQEPIRSSGTRTAAGKPSQKNPDREPIGSSGTRTAPDVSIVLPVFNEALSLPLLWDELGAVLEASPWTAEVIFVDDGSTDGSADIVKKLQSGDPRVRLVRFTANAGLSAAFDAGLRRAAGRYVVTMDSDLQNDPADIPRLLGHLETFDVATGRRRRRRDPWLKRVSSRIANRVRNWATAEAIGDSACSLRAMRRECVADLPAFRGAHRFVPTLLRLAGHSVVEVDVEHRPRRFGISHYGVRNRAWVAFQDLLAVRWMQRRRLRYEVVTEDETSRGTLR